MFFSWLFPDFIFRKGLIETLEKVSHVVHTNQSIVVYGHRTPSSEFSEGEIFTMIGNARLFPWRFVAMFCENSVSSSCILKVCHHNNISVVDASKTIVTEDIFPRLPEPLKWSSKDFVKHLSKYESQYNRNGNVSIVSKTLQMGPDPFVPSILPSLRPGEVPILTLSTTFRPDRYKHRVYFNVIRNWAQLIPYVIPVLYTVNTDPEIIKLASELGWDVREAPRVNKQKVPHLRGMLQDAITNYKSHFHGYCNGDILFTSDIYHTLTAIKNKRFGSTLVVGQRSNFHLFDRAVYSLAKVKDIYDYEAQLFRIDAEDYFIVSGDPAPWDSLQDVIIGRPGYDNYVVSELIQHPDVTVIDATVTLPAVHQTDGDGNFAGRGSSGSDFNLELIGKNYNYKRGRTNQTPWKTVFDSDSRVRLEERSGFLWILNKLIIYLGWL
jgi:hypothetical protein